MKNKINNKKIIKLTKNELKNISGGDFWEKFIKFWNISHEVTLNSDRKYMG